MHVMCLNSRIFTLLYSHNKYNSKCNAKKKAYSTINNNTILNVGIINNIVWIMNQMTNSNDKRSTFSPK